MDDEVFATLLIVGAVLLTSVIVIYLFVVGADSPSPSSICQEQCVKQDMDFYNYNNGGYQNAACLCKTKGDGLIKTIYIE